METAYLQVKMAMMRALRDCGRSSHDAQLIAVSKTRSQDEIRPLIAKGQRLFAENKVQEALLKWPSLKKETPDLQLHLIGSLQTNKAKQALEVFDVIETLDRENLVLALVHEIKKGAYKPRFYVQVNTGEEKQKSGILPQEADEFIQFCIQEHRLNVEGLMCIPPAYEPPSPHFALLAKIGKKNGLKKLSMGMSADFECALQMGATSVRVGSAIFGERVSPL